MTKIEALKQTIVNVETGRYEYNWMSMDHCNCGVVARTLLGGEFAKDAGLNDSPAIRECGFSSYAYCLTTNLPLPKVFTALKSAGFTYQELYDLETMSDEKILSRSNINQKCTGGMNYFYQYKPNLLRYLKAWAEILEGEQPKIQEPAKIAHSFSAVTFVKVMEAELISES